MNLKTVPTTYMSELAALWSDTGRGVFACGRLGGGLVACVFRRPPRSTLYSRLSRGGANGKTPTVSSGFLECVKESVVPGSPHNCVVTGGLHYVKGSAESYLHRGTIPLFWSDLPTELVREILFKAADVVTVFNPAHLICRLEHVGFSVAAFTPPWGLSLRWKARKRIGRFEQPDYFVRLIPFALFREDYVARLMKGAVKKAEALGAPPRTRIEFGFTDLLLPRRKD